MYNPPMKISVIVPIFNEACTIENTLQHLKKSASAHLGEIIVVDGGSDDNSVQLAKKHAQVVQIKVKSRAVQMNKGAKLAKHAILYFVHADSLPPQNYDQLIVKAIQQGFHCGCFRSRFDRGGWFLKLCSYFTRFQPIFCRGGGQTLFVDSQFFQTVGGYKNELFVMEEYDLILRLKKKSPFRILPENTIVSARKYRKNGTFRLYSAYVLIFLLYFAGTPQRKLSRIYSLLIR